MSTLPEEKLLVGEPAEAEGPKLWPLFSFFAVLLGLAVVRVILGYVSVPIQAQMVATLITTAVFVAAPVFALYHAASFRWTVKVAILFTVVGLLLQFGVGYLIGAKLSGGQGAVAAVCVALGVQCGFPMWCVGLGALLASLLKDRNLLIPVSIFLAAFDIFLVVNPIGVTHQILQHMPNVLPTIAYTVPKASAAPKGGPVGVFAYVGPADFLFMGMFFVALFRFKLRSHLTVLWLIPAILVYLLLSLKIGAIPLLVPIGLTVLIVNWPEFKMNSEELLSTVGVFLVACIIVAGSFVMKAKQAASSRQESAQGVTAPANSPPQASGG